MPLLRRAASQDAKALGYPTFSTSVVGIGARTLFNTSITLGGLVEVGSGEKRSDGTRTGGIDVANGQWIALDVLHDIESETPNDARFTQFNGVKPQ